MSTSPFRIRGWHVLLMLLSFFGAVIAVNVYFISAALRTFPGEDVRRSYVQGLQYNETLAERQVQAALGWQVQAALAGEGAAALEITLLTHEGAPLEGASIEGELQWPTDSRHDRDVNFTPMGGGRYVAQLGPLDAGRWRLRARAERADGALDFESELTWRASR